MRSSLDPGLGVSSVCWTAGYFAAFFSESKLNTGPSLQVCGIVDLHAEDKIRQNLSSMGAGHSSLSVELASIKSLVVGGMSCEILGPKQLGRWNTFESWNVMIIQTRTVVGALHNDF